MDNPGEGQNSFREVIMETTEIIGNVIKIIAIILGIVVEKDAEKRTTSDNCYKWGIRLTAFGIFLNIVGILLP